MKGYPRSPGWNLGAVASPRPGRLDSFSASRWMLFPLPDMTRMLDNVPPPAVTLIEGVPYGTGGRRLLHLDLARPRLPTSQPLPAVVFIHGGGWMHADRSNGAPIIARLARHGFVAASIDYRLSGEAGFPAQIEDCKCAVRFLRAFAAEYGIDPQRIGVAGASAGGHLASLVGLTPDEPAFEGRGGWPKHSSRVSAVATLYGISDLVALAAAPDTRDCVVKLMRGTPAKKRSLYRQASPLRRVGAGAPPFLLVHGDRDTLVPRGHSDDLHAALQEAGGLSTLRIIRGMDHASIATLPPRVLTDLVAFFRRQLAPPERKARDPA